MPEFENRAEWEAKLKRELLRLTEPQTARLMKLLGDPPDVANVPASFWNGLGDDLAQTLKPTLQAVYIDRARETNAIVPKVLRVDWHLVNAPAAAWAEQYSFSLVKGIDTTSRDRLQTYVSGFFANEGTTVGALRDQIATIFGDSRAVAIATTEVTRAADEGDEGIVKEIETAHPRIEMIPFLETSMDEWVCKICGPLNGKELTGKLEGVRPPLHTHCRCGRRFEPRPRGKR